MIYVTHDQVEAMTMADKIVVLNQGRVEQIGRPLDLYHHRATASSAGFIGSPAMNFLAGSIAAADQRDGQRDNRRRQDGRRAAQAGQGREWARR